MSDVFDVYNWYWKVNGSTTQVYSSKVGDYVPVNNPAYVAWLAAENLPTAIESEAALGDVLAPYSLRPTPANILDGYQDSQSRKLTLEIAAKLFFNLENRMRALEGRPSVSAAKYRAVVKGLM